MSNVEQITVEKADPEVKDLYQVIQKQLGTVPNMLQNMGSSAAVLKGFLDWSDAINHTSFNARLREQIALAVSEVNQCNYCLAAHTQLAKMHRLPDEDIILARKGDAQDPKTREILHFVRLVVEKKGHVSPQDIERIKLAGVSDKELVEIIFNISLAVFTNYFNVVVDTKLDFPNVPKLNS